MTYHAPGNESVTRRRTGRFLPLLGFSFLVLTGLSGFLLRDEISNRVARVFAAAEEDPIPRQKVEKVSFQLEVPAFGEIVGLESVPVPTPSTRSGGLKVAWLIPEGSFVKPDDVLVRYDSTEAQLNLEKQENTLEANQERSKVTDGKQSTDEKVLGIDLTDAKNEYQYATTVMPQDETIFSKWDIIEAKINAGLSKERIDFLTNKGRVQKRSARADLQILAIEKNRAQQEFTIAKQTLDSLQLIAPKDGLVLYRRDRMRDPQVGDESQPGQVLVEIVDLKALMARLFVLERDAGSLTKDKPVVIRLDSIPDKEFHGTVRQVTALAQPLERNSPLKYFTCDVTIQDAYADMPRIKPGMALKADVILEHYDSCFVVPLSAVTTKETQNLVFVLKDDRFQSRSVKTGAGSHGQAVILAGIEANETIALRNPFETRKAHLPDFSKAAAPAGGMGGGMRIMMR